MQIIASRRFIRLEARYQLEVLFFMHQSIFFGGGYFAPRLVEENLFNYTLAIFITMNLETELETSA